MRDRLPEPLEALPGALVKEAHRHVEGGTAPHLERECLREAFTRGIGRAQQLCCAHPSGEERLVCVSHCRVCDQESLVGANSLREPLGALREQHVAPPLQLRLGPPFRLRGDDRVGHRRGALQLGRVGTQLCRVAVHGEVAQVANQLLHLAHLGHALLALGGEVPRGSGDGQQRRVVVDERGGHHARLKLGVSEDVEEERNVCLDAADAGLLQRAAHAAHHLLEVGATRRVLDKE
mmetsp:Transcript_41747/g.103726  ORF Transcript_41747/g.103726 Transcript_41747/m.103726 type:complete len:235 (+) Transcript_41747:792-1496(+)